MNKSDKIIEWLLKGDPSIRYQVHRDILGSPIRILQKERLAISKEGWGKKFLELQDASGMWDRGLYTPKWTSTFYTLQLMMQMGMDINPQIETAMRLILDKGYFKDGGINLWRLAYSETCVNGMFLAITSYFGLNDDRINGLAKNLIKTQMADGGWNCRWPHGAKHSSMHTTISVLEGLWEFEKRITAEQKPLIKMIRNKGIEFLLQHHLFRSHRTGRIIDPKMKRFSFPPRWHFDVMRGLDHLRECRHEKDERMAEGIDLIRSKQGQDGYWKLQQKYSGRVFFDMEESGEPSRWNTLRALRILKWWEEM
jgi:hypothetical protein